MKKICIYIILISSIYIGCLHNLLGGFMSVHADHWSSHIHMSENHHMVHDEKIEVDCEEKSHECCISPYSDASPQHLAYSIKKSFENNDTSSDINDLALLHENFLICCLEKLNSPPLDTSQNEQYIYSKSQYQYLVWVIKNNA